MYFILRDGWHCQLLVIELDKRGGCDFKFEEQQHFEHATSIGRGGIWLNLTEEQYL